MDRCPVEEKQEGRTQVVTVQKKDAVEVACVAVKPIPARELWFEKVWNQFNEMRG